MFHAGSPAAFLIRRVDAFGDVAIRAVPRSKPAILADLAMRGWAISFLTLAFVAFSICFRFFLRKIG
jgi:hypothetical protein